MGSQKRITNCNIDPVGDKGPTHKGTLVTTIQKWIMSGVSNCSQILTVLQNCLRAGAGPSETRSYPDEYSKFHPNVICFIWLSWVQYFTRFFFLLFLNHWIGFLQNGGEWAICWMALKPQILFFTTSANPFFCSSSLFVPFLSLPSPPLPSTLFLS